MKTNVAELWRNLTIGTLTCAALLFFCDAGSNLWILSGLLYAAFFEYFYHRCISHTEIFPLAAQKHRQHHRVWRGHTAISIDSARKHLNEDWYFFPAALLAHFAIGKFGFGYFPWQLAVAFTLFYLQFEFFHWATHMNDNWFDNWLSKKAHRSLVITVLYALRRQQAQWHLEHHEWPQTRFNFSPPYLGDKIFRT